MKAEMFVVGGVYSAMDRALSCIGMGWDAAAVRMLELNTRDGGARQSWTFWKPANNYY